MGRSQNINVNRSLEEIDSNFERFFERFKISVEKVTVDVVDIARERELEIEPEGVTELL